VSLVEGDYQGFGFIEWNESYNPEDLSDSIKPYANNNDIKRILNGFLASPLPKMYHVLEAKEV